ncbi:hypothetical protein KHA80_19525 [Anaerobacillus sp. HL2]|nr:hypothetical protein KHA80_19525 [Anaerobacillus sp. HL2]
MGGFSIIANGVNTIKGIIDITKEVVAMLQVEQQLIVMELLCVFKLLKATKGTVLQSY